MPLPKSVFNPRLYARIQNLWFADLPASATVPNDALQQRWFPRDPAAREAFDSECREHLEATLEAIRPGSAPVEELQRDLAEELQVRGVYFNGVSRGRPDFAFSMKSSS
jgi:hypothetical protein